MSILVEIEDGTLRLEKYSSFVSDPAAGAISTFTGVTRNNFEGKEVLRLEYEAYKPMALKLMRVKNVELGNLRFGGRSSARRRKGSGRSVEWLSLIESERWK